MKEAVACWAKSVGRSVRSSGVVGTLQSPPRLTPRSSTVRPSSLTNHGPRVPSRPTRAIEMGALPSDPTCARGDVQAFRRTASPTAPCGRPPASGTGSVCCCSTDCAARGPLLRCPLPFLVVFLVRLRRPPCLARRSLKLISVDSAKVERALDGKQSLCAEDPPIWREIALKVQNQKMATAAENVSAKAERERKREERERAKERE